jgi:hypothetical protein
MASATTKITYRDMKNTSVQHQKNNNLSDVARRLPSRQLVGAPLLMAFTRARRRTATCGTRWSAAVRGPL